jgi:hypothetical protein
VTVALSTITLPPSTPTMNESPRRFSLRRADVPPLPTGHDAIGQQRGELGLVLQERVQIGWDLGERGVGICANTVNGPGPFNVDSRPSAAMC